MLILLACAAANALAVREAIRFGRFTADLADRRTAQANAAKAAAIRADRLRSARPSIRPAGITR